MIHQLNSMQPCLTCVDPWHLRNEYAQKMLALYKRLGAVLEKQKENGNKSTELTDALQKQQQTEPLIQSTILAITTNKRATDDDNNKFTTQIGELSDTIDPTHAMALDTPQPLVDGSDKSILVNLLESEMRLISSAIDYMQQHIENAQTEFNKQPVDQASQNKLQQAKTNVQQASAAYLAAQTVTKSLDESLIPNEGLKVSVFDPPSDVARNQVVHTQGEFDTNYTQFVNTDCKSMKNTVDGFVATEITAFRNDTKPLVNDVFDATQNLFDTDSLFKHRSAVFTAYYALQHAYWALMLWLNKMQTTPDFLQESMQSWIDMLQMERDIWMKLQTHIQMSAQMFGDTMTNITSNLAQNKIVPSHENIMKIYSYFKNATKLDQEIQKNRVPIREALDAIRKQDEGADYPMFSADVMMPIWSFHPLDVNAGQIHNIAEWDSCIVHLTKFGLQINGFHTMFTNLQNVFHAKADIKAMLSLWSQTKNTRNEIINALEQAQQQYHQAYLYLLEKERLPRTLTDGLYLAAYSYLAGYCDYQYCYNLFIQAHVAYMRATLSNIQSQIEHTRMVLFKTDSDVMTAQQDMIAHKRLMENVSLASGVRYDFSNVIEAATELSTYRSVSDIDSQFENDLNTLQPIYDTIRQAGRDIVQGSGNNIQYRGEFFAYMQNNVDERRNFETLRLAIILKYDQQSPFDMDEMRSTHYCNINFVRGTESEAHCHKEKCDGLEAYASIECAVLADKQRKFTTIGPCDGKDIDTCIQNTKQYPEGFDFCSIFARNKATFTECANQWNDPKTKTKWDGIRNRWIQAQNQKRDELVSELKNISPFQGVDRKTLDDLEKKYPDLITRMKRDMNHNPDTVVKIGLHVNRLYETYNEIKQHPELVKFATPWHHALEKYIQFTKCKADKPFDCIHETRCVGACPSIAIVHG